jgi:3-hydroxyacyl-CoA dehydrogenase/enoyl-CoA hydratase/3-hydroxybutyryl-CoA epimerase
VGAVFGLGFPPFRGGPFRWADAVGAKVLVEKLERLRDRLGQRFAPAPLLVEHAARGSRFHG